MRTCQQKRRNRIRILLVFILVFLLLRTFNYIDSYYIVRIFGRNVPILVDEVYSPNEEYILRLYYKSPSATTNCMVIAEIDSTANGFHKCIYKGYHVNKIVGCWLDDQTVKINNAELNIHYDVFNNFWIDPRRVRDNPTSLEAVRRKIPSNILERLIDYFVKYTL